MRFYVVLQFQPNCGMKCVCESTATFTQPLCFRNCSACPLVFYPSGHNLALRTFIWKCNNTKHSNTKLHEPTKLKSEPKKTWPPNFLLSLQRLGLSTVDRMSHIYGTVIRVLYAVPVDIWNSDYHSQYMADCQPYFAILWWPSYGSQYLK